MDDSLVQRRDWDDGAHNLGDNRGSSRGRLPSGTTRADNVIRGSCQGKSSAAASVECRRGLEDRQGKLERYY